MQYRFSPIQSEEKLFEALTHIHETSHALCVKVLGKELGVAGNIGIFCHYETEYEFLKGLSEKLCDESQSMHGKYFKLREPFLKYTHLYIRKPDPYRAQVGDLDFAMEADAYDDLKSSLPKGARIFDRPGVDMVELFDPDFEVLAYVVGRSTS